MRGAREASLARLPAGPRTAFWRFGFSRPQTQLRTSPSPSGRKSFAEFSDKCLKKK
jgi:hypothetical protein